MNSVNPSYRVPVIAVATLFLFAGCAGKKKVEKAESALPTVGVVAATRGDIPFTISVTGALSAERDVVLSPKNTGRVKSVTVREGDRVSAGQIVMVQESSMSNLSVQEARAAVAMAEARLARSITGMKVQPASTDASIRGAKATLDAAEARMRAVDAGARPQERAAAEEAVNVAQANMENARQNYVRIKGLFERDAIGRQQLDVAKANLTAAEAQHRSAQQNLNMVQEGSRQEDIDAARANVQQAKEALAAAETGRSQNSLRVQEVAEAKAAVAQAKTGLAQSMQVVDDCITRSSISGVVAQRDTEPGAMLDGGKPAMRIVDMNSIYYEARVPENLVRYVRSGQAVHVSVDAFPGQSFKGVVAKIYPVGQAGSRDFTVRVNIANANGKLRPEMFARGEIVADIHHDVVVVPRDALLQRTSGVSVFVVSKDGIAKELDVSMGYTNPSSAEVTLVKAGDMVVVQGQENLADGDKVKAEKTVSNINN